MEYCENTLRHLIDHGEVWKEEQRCWRLFRQMLEGVDFIHSKGIIHRRVTWYLRRPISTPHSELSIVYYRNG